MEGSKKYAMEKISANICKKKNTSLFSYSKKKVNVGIAQKKKMTNYHIVYPTQFTRVMNWRIVLLFNYRNASIVRVHTIFFKFLLIL